MPVTKTAERALRSSKRKEQVNSILRSKLEAAIRVASKSGKKEDITLVSTLADRAAKLHLIHKNKAARIKSQASQFGRK